MKDGGGMKTSTFEVNMEPIDYAKLKVKYKFTTEYGETTTVEQNFDKFDENELVHKLVQSATSLMMSAGYNAPLSDVPCVIEWLQPKYNKFPSYDGDIGRKFLITPLDPTKDVDVAVWNGESFEGYDNEEVLAWTDLPMRYDDTEYWY